jgi:hypothetical protein
LEQSVLKLRKEIIMKKTQLLTLVFVLTAGLLSGLLGKSVLESAKAQSFARDKWEYCAITDLRAAGQNIMISSINASVKICYFESGCRKETINVSVDTSDFEEAKNVVLGRAVTMLGQQGWEMVGEATFGFNKDGDRKVLYFRRHQR